MSHLLAFAAFNHDCGTPRAVNGNGDLTCLAVGLWVGESTSSPQRWAVAELIRGSMIDSQRPIRSKFGRRPVEVARL